MKRILLATVLVFSGLLASEAEARSCYNHAEAEAEQALRIHSELMVIGLNCQAMRFSNGDNLYSRYRRFTQDHSHIFENYEQRLIEYYRQRGDRDPEATLNTLRTDLANKISHDAAKMQPHTFCNRYAGRIVQVQGMSGPALRQWASTFYPSHPVSHPICEQ